MTVSPSDFSTFTATKTYAGSLDEGFTIISTCDQYPELVRTDSEPNRTVITVAGEPVEFTYKAMAEAINRHRTRTTPQQVKEPQMQLIIDAAEFSREFEFHAHDAGEQTSEQLLLKAVDFLEEEVGETKRDILAKDFAKILDGFGDVMFVALNGIYKTARVMGYDDEDSVEIVQLVMRHINTANLAKKQPDGTVLRVNGKVQKPAGWVEPSYDDMIKGAPNDLSKVL